MTENAAPAAAPTVVRAEATAVRHEGAGGRVIRIGYAACVYLSDGSHRVCSHSHRDMRGAAIIGCVQRIAAEVRAAEGK